MIKIRSIILVLFVYLIWTSTTFLFEGRLHTFLRPEAVIDRVIYILMANFLIGIVFSVIVLRYLTHQKQVMPKKAGFREFRYSLISVVVGFILGISIYFLQNPPSTHPVVIFNAYVQVLSVTIAEIMICWAVVGSVIESSFRNLGKIVSLIVAFIITSILFGFYHFAHSPPFNNLNMVLFLSFIGLFTGLFFFISRDIYGTIVFHNFFGIKGVIQALIKADALSSYKQISPIILITAFIAVSILILMHVIFLSSKNVSIDDMGVLD
ncbi:MAG: CPBP family intramembrane glutamic endopeptidase [candidate division KSB1 bacterium]|nr:CPBP family intramembrane glutamic endopeptidase [candidate division KSB1 bacterium]